MKVKDKIKAGIIAGATMLLTGCGLNKGEEAKVEERSDSKPAMGFPVANGFESDRSYEEGSELLGIKLSNDTEHEYAGIVDWEKSSIEGDSASAQILSELQKAKIPVTKGDSILHDVEVHGNFNGDIKITNPRYVLNKVEKKVVPDNSERSGNIEISRRVNPDDIASKTYKVDDKTIGVKNWYDEEIQKKLTEVRKLVQDKEAEKRLNKGDTVKVMSDFMFEPYIKKQAVVKENGVSPSEDVNVVQHKRVTKVVFDYQVKTNG